MGGWFFRSLRFRLLGPLLASAIVAVIFVSIASNWLGAKWANQQLNLRYEAIEQTIANSTFPLNKTVLDSLAKLTQTQLVTLGKSGQVLDSTLPVRPSSITSSNSAITPPKSNGQRSPTYAKTEVNGQAYLICYIDTVFQNARVDKVFRVAVLFDEDQIEANQRRAAMLPLFTGLSTILALSTVTLVLGTRLVNRLARLQKRVEAVAGGDFMSKVSDSNGDEIGRLGGAVDAMAVQLGKLWSTVNRQQSERLLHQIAGGMAHQLRNSLTGARMAVELHARQCGRSEDEALQVALHQMELTEDYVRRLLLVSSGRQDKDRPSAALQCWTDVRTSLAPMARHLQIDISWDLDQAAERFIIRDGSTWVAATTNLIHNAMQAGSIVRVSMKLDTQRNLLLCIADNGPGIPEAIASEIFNPFITSKHEGIGLGLSVVQRAAEHLGGKIRWTRQHEWTVFEFLIHSI